jgi:curved DNA-binding protein CbpA
MAVNRRNFYRILHVQPEAPEPVITASYRAMMSKLRLHPDLGGNTQNAQLINEAYGVLRDPLKRAQYDLHLEQRMAGAGAARAPKSESSARMARVCAFCAEPRPREILPDTRCDQCDSPLAPAPGRPAGKNELFGRRAMPRMSRSDAVHFLPAWQAPARAARLRDLSMTGISLVTDVTVAKHQTIRITAPLFDILAVVVACRSDGRRVEIHASVLTAIFMHPKGVVVSVRT